MAIKTNLSKDLQNIKQKQKKVNRRNLRNEINEYEPKYRDKQFDSQCNSHYYNYKGYNRCYYPIIPHDFKRIKTRTKIVKLNTEEDILEIQEKAEYH